MLTLVRRMFEYDAWANSLVFSSLRDQGDAGPDAKRIFAHLLAAESVWLARLREEPGGTAVWPPFTFESSARQVNELPQRWAELLGGLEPADLAEYRTYRNSSGDEFTFTVQDILLHVMAHSAYHRGQISLLLKDLQLTPAVTDYIAFARSHPSRALPDAGEALSG